MTTEVPAQLDHKELLHCAILAGEQGEHDRALVLLKQAQALNNTAQTALLMAAQHAELRLYDRALAGMEQALALDPQLWIARFQLAQLLITLDREPEALAQWQQLQNSEAPNYLKLFSQGLIAAQQQDAATAKQCLRDGMAQNQDNAPLNQDMQQVLIYLETRTADSAAPQVSVTPLQETAPEQKTETVAESASAHSETEASGLSKMLLSRYQQS